MSRLLIKIETLFQFYKNKMQKHNMDGIIHDTCEHGSPKAVYIKLRSSMRDHCLKGTKNPYKCTTFHQSSAKMKATLYNNMKAGKRLLPVILAQREQ